MAALAMVSLGACATYNNALDAVGYLSSSAVVLKVPYERQPTEDLCGLAAADMVGGYYDAPIVSQARQKLERQADIHGGITGGDLRTAFVQSGYQAFLFPGDLHRDAAGLLRNLDRGRPLIVMYTSGPASVGHYVVLAGYDPRRRTFLVLDPRLGRRVESRRDFRHRWTPSGHFTLLAMPANLQPRTAQVH